MNIEGVREGIKSKTYDNKITLSVFVAIAAISGLVLLQYHVFAQQQQNLPPIGLPPGITISHTPPPGVRAPTPSELQIPPEAQSKIAASDAYARAMIDEFNHRLGNDTSQAHAIQVFKQMTAEGKINCPTPFTNPGHCILAPPGAPAVIR